MATRLEETYPETNRGYGVRVIPIRDSYIDRRSPHRGRLDSAVGFVLLIMCANLANLMRCAVRRVARARVRSAMGAIMPGCWWTTCLNGALAALAPRLDCCCHAGWGSMVGIFRTVVAVLA